MNNSPATRETRKALLIDELCAAGRLFGERQWCLATSGNFSVRVGPDEFLITQSGKDKSSLSAGDLMICDMKSQPQVAHLRPSAETALHQCLYRHDEKIGAVLHTHSVISTVFSRRAGKSIAFSDFEMQKAFTGISSHDTQISIPVFDNTQDMPALATTLQSWLHDSPPAVPAFLVRGHGLYAWGRDLPEAKRHIEGTEFLMSCAWQEMLAGSS